MAQVVNIRRDVDDKFYRYKMPSLLTKIEGKGNGIKTVIPNMSDVSRALSRPPTYPTKFFGCELGAQTSFDEKGDRYIVNGAHDATRLRELLDAFIDKFVLCAECKNPETDLIIVARTEDIFRDCKACGARTGVDMRHKLTTFIIKNPPKRPKKDKKAKATDKDKDKDGKENGSAEEEAAAEGGGSDDDDDEFTKKLKADAAQLPTAEQAERGEEDWALDTSEAAVKARQKEMAALNLGDSDEGEGDGADPYSELAVWLEGNRGSSAADVYKKIQELGIEKKHKVAEILGRALFTENIEKEIPNYQPLFAKVITSEKHQKSLLGGLERFVGVEHPALVAAVPKILMAFYQVDALEEDVIKQWGTHVSRKYVDRDVSKRVRKAADPFIKWLAEADDESE
ncbi:eukaryotic translation initiation factor 5 [Ceratobasidium sp. AG-Ba]|nr:eukaryotic translation initiation factor 5 [Ceratobasidium sp. AG-Ba]QRV91306.1 eukaryotic translation initiation factor 5 [Ceratobasidium sp. AG-Ba]QRW05375.1 eukaryotic translation initiation factor 5 [Ceratobasidium sp. AG-Ba]